MKDTKTIEVADSRDFRYEVEIDHSPHLGFSTAYYKGRVIAQVDNGKIRPPMGDNDKEWEEYEERLDEWKAEVESDIKQVCQEHFNKNGNKFIA